MNGGWLRHVGRGILGFTAAVGLDALARLFLLSGYYVFPLGHVALPVLPLLFWLRPGWPFTLIVLAPLWTACGAIVPALGPGPRRVVLFLVLGLHVHASLMPLYLLQRYHDPVICAAALAYCALLFVSLGGLYWLCCEPAPQE